MIWASYFKSVMRTNNLRYVLNSQILENIYNVLIQFYYLLERHLYYYSLNQKLLKPLLILFTIH